MQYDLYIGIDPSGERPKRNAKNTGWLKGNNGLCILDPDGNIVTLQALTIFEIFDLLPIYIKGKKGIVRIEQPNGQPVFPHRLTRDNVRTYGRKNRDLGKNQCASNLLAVFCESLGLDVEEVTPKQKGAKWTIQYFQALSDMDIDPTQHEIDAYQLAIQQMDQERIRARSTYHSVNK